MKDSKRGCWEEVGGTRQLPSREKKKMLWEQQTTPFACGVGCPVKIEIDEAKKVKLGASLLRVL